jgi:hypothetical protein
VPACATHCLYPGLGLKEDLWLSETTEAVSSFMPLVRDVLEEARWRWIYSLLFEESVVSLRLGWDVMPLLYCA